MEKSVKINQDDIDDRAEQNFACERPEDDWSIVAAGKHRSNKVATHKERAAFREKARLELEAEVEEKANRTC